MSNLEVKDEVKLHSDQPHSNKSSPKDKAAKKVTISTQADEILDESSRKSPQNEEDARPAENVQGKSNSPDILRIKYHEVDIDRRVQFITQRMEKGQTTKLQAFGIAISTAVFIACTVQGNLKGVRQAAQVLNDSRPDVRDGQTCFGLEITLSRDAPKYPRKKQTSRPATQYVKKSELEQKQSSNSDDKKSVKTEEVPDQEQGEKEMPEEEPPKEPEIPPPYRQERQSSHKPQPRVHDESFKDRSPLQIQHSKSQTRYGMPHMPQPKPVIDVSRHFEDLNQTYQQRPTTTVYRTNSSTHNEPNGHVERQDNDDRRTFNRHDDSHRSRSQRHTYHDQPHKNESMFYDTSMHLQKKRTNPNDGYRVNRPHYQMDQDSYFKPPAHRNNHYRPPMPTVVSHPVQRGSYRTVQFTGNGHQRPNNTNYQPMHHQRSGQFDQPFAPTSHGGQPGYQNMRGGRPYHQMGPRPDRPLRRWNDSQPHQL